jgi:SAM-dependent methyltransferase
MRILRTLYRAKDFRSAKEKFLISNDLSDKEKSLLNKISLRVHSKDGMYQPKAALHYLSVGFSALRCIENALMESKEDKAILHILDFPCGFGRVLRFLKVRFPDAEITVSDIDPAALDFCKRVFHVKPAMSGKDFSNLSLSGKYDLIWCGSLISHIDEKAITDLLKCFHDRLTHGGLCVFTTHGKISAEWIQQKKVTYRLTEMAQRKVLSQFHEKGYGYADYNYQRGIGISLVSHDRMIAIAHRVGKWKEIFYLERGWDNHQDVYGFSKTKPAALSPG